DGQRWTYANLALMRAALCAAIMPGTRAALGPLLFEGMRQKRISVERYQGPWENVGTPDQLAAMSLPLHPKFSPHAPGGI
ncbi:MAG TPA: nucleotidyltransferase family protein, partial [Burkholderiaceae bacterium]|nr:nucleotidyltransferase family protein [Burkholderiaceae bacterium]